MVPVSWQLQVVFFPVRHPDIYLLLHNKTRPKNIAYTNKWMNIKHLNNNRIIALERTATGELVLKSVYWYQILFIVSVVLKTQKIFCSHGGS